MADYDKLSKEEREAKDKADRAREAEEQAGTLYFSPAVHRSHQFTVSATLSLETGVGRGRYRRTCA